MGGGRADEPEFEEVEYGCVEKSKRWEPTAVAKTEDSNWRRVTIELDWI